MLRWFHVVMVIVAMSTCVSTSASAQQSASTEGEVRKIDEAAGKITLKHGAIKNLDMDAMTMVFRVQDPAILKAVKVGDKVRFEANRVDGAITVTKMQKLK